MGFKDFLLIIILIVAIIVGYDALQGIDLVRDIAPGIYTTPDAPVLYVAPSTVAPTWTPEPINFQATTDAYLNSLPTPEPVVVVATRPPFENLPLQGPYGPNEIAVCKATWEQGLEGQLAIFQQQYEFCYGVLLNTGFFE